MKLMTFPEINDLENGQQVTSLQGKITKVFDQITGDGQFGTWWLQSIILNDEHAHEVKLTWNGEDSFGKEWEGREILVESGHDKKDQLAGLKKEIRKKSGKTYESVKFDDRAKVKVLSGGPTKTEIPKNEYENESFVPPADQDALLRDPDCPEAPSTAPELPLPTVGGNGGVMEARQHLMKACNLYNLCIKAAVTSICPNIPDEQRTNEQFQSTLASLWIEASSRRSTDGVTWWSYLDKMPEKPIQ